MKCEIRAKNEGGLLYGCTCLKPFLPQLTKDIRDTFGTKGWVTGNIELDVVPHNRKALNSQVGSACVQDGDRA